MQRTQKTQNKCVRPMRTEIRRTYPLSATMHLAPLVGSRKNAKSREGSQSSVSVLGRYPPIECVIDLVIWRDLRRRLELGVYEFDW